MTRDEMARIAVRVVAEQTARKMVRERLRQQGIKLSYVSPREIAAQAKLLLASPENCGGTPKGARVGLRMTDDDLQSEFAKLGATPDNRMHQETMMLLR